MTRPQTLPAEHNRSGSAFSLRKRLLLGTAVLALVLPPAVILLRSPAQQPAPALVASAALPQPVLKPAPRVERSKPAVTRLAKFGRVKASRDARQMANWVLSTGDHQGRSFVIVDKKNAKVFVFNTQGRLQAATPALLGAAQGDDSVPGIGDKPLSQVLPQEKTTPAGRFVAELGMNTKGEDIVWVDYDAAVSMHRVRAKVKAERRLERLASPTAADNRISFGCINLPKQFYEKTLKPTVQARGAVIYVLPETRPLRETFASFYDVTAPRNAARSGRPGPALAATHGMS